MWIRYLIIFLTAAGTAIPSYATKTSTLLNNSQQLMVVTSPNWDSSHAQLQRYQRNAIDQAWQPVGVSIKVVLGKKGMTKTKKEGDLRTPSGIFSIGTAFGFAKKAAFNIKLPYLPIIDTTVCVDDLKSPYYNQIIDDSKQVSWHSGEQMHEKVPQYTWGLMINYNISKPIHGTGSCIFMHVWVSSNKPTAGCIAMSETKIKQVLAWLDPAKKPIIAIFPVSNPLIAN